MTADEYDTGEATSPTARSGAVGGGTGTAAAASCDDRTSDAATGTASTPRTVAETTRRDPEERLHV